MFGLFSSGFASAFANGARAADHDDFLYAVIQRRLHDVDRAADVYVEEGAVPLGRVLEQPCEVNSSTTTGFDCAFASCGIISPTSRPSPRKPDAIRDAILCVMAVLPFFNSVVLPYYQKKRNTGR